MMERLCQIWPKLEPKKREDVAFFIVGHGIAVPPEWMDALKEKFPLSISFDLPQVPVTGWPHSTNVLWKTMAKMILEGKNDIPFSDAILTTETDIAPLSRNWLDRMLDEWRESQADVMGCWQSYQYPHFNGNMMLKRYLMKLLVDESHPAPHVPWDLFAGPRLLAHPWKNSSTILTFWREKTISRKFLEELSKTSSIIHGVRDGSALDYADSLVA